MDYLKKRKKLWDKLAKRALIASVLSLIPLVMIYCTLVKHDISAEKERYRYIAKNEAEHIVTTIDCVMARTNTLKALVQDHGGTTDFFGNVAEDIYLAVREETGISLKNFAIAPDGVVAAVYPLEGNESLIGFNFMDLSKAGNAEAMEAYEKGNTVLTNPFELVQGGLGMAGRSPVILHDGDNKTLWGLVTVTIDFENLMDVLNLDNFSGMGMNYALSYLDADGTSHVMATDNAIRDDAVSMRFQVRNLAWELAVSPNRGWVSGWRLVLGALVILTISGFVGLLADILFRLRESNEMLRKMSNTDRLTNCLNRRAYEEALSKIERDGGYEHLVYITADLNGLKQVNDTLGHLAGDELILGATECLQESFGPYGKVFRIGGDEFTVIADLDGRSLSVCMEKFRRLTDAWKGETAKELSVSVGVSSRDEFPEAALKVLIKTADDRMYADKRTYYETHNVDRRKQR